MCINNVHAHMGKSERVGLIIEIYVFVQKKTETDVKILRHDISILFELHFVKNHFIWL